MIRDATRLQIFLDNFVFSFLIDLVLQISNTLPIGLVKAGGAVFKMAINSIKISRIKKKKDSKNAMTTK